MLSTPQSINSSSGERAIALSFRARECLPACFGVSSAAQGADLLAVPVDRSGDAVLQADLRLPTSLSELGDFEQLLRRPVGLRGVPLCLAVESDDARDRLRDLADRHVGARTDIDLHRPVVVLEQVQTGVGHVVDVKELPSRRAGPPVRD